MTTSKVLQAAHPADLVNAKATNWTHPPRSLIVFLRNNVLTVAVFDNALADEGSPPCAIVYSSDGSDLDVARCTLI